MSEQREPQDPNLTLSLPQTSGCDKAPIHLISGIQNTGCLLLFSWPDQRVRSASRNAPEVLSPTLTGLASRDIILGARVDHLFGADFIQQIEPFLKTQNWDGMTKRHLNYRRGDHAFDVSLFISGDLFGLEVLAQVDSGLGSFQVNQLVSDFLASLKRCASLHDAAKITCQAIRKLTAFERVMMYRFLSPSWHGEVIAEDRVIHSQPYLHHRFPATDIPKTARDLYLRNTIRLISDTEVGVSELVPSVHPESKKQFDLSDSQLRAVAPVHLEYLRNMSVRASLSIAVTTEQDLWGLIACHNSKPLQLSQVQMSACEIIANAFSVFGPSRELIQAHEDRMRFELKLRRLFDSVRQHADPVEELFRHPQELMETFGITGIILATNDSCDSGGITPTVQESLELASWLRELMKTQHPAQDVLTIDDLPHRSERWQHLRSYASGLLAIRMKDAASSLLIFLRPEKERTIVWGGDPRKQLTKRGFGGELNPRTSFEAWSETIRGQSSEWQNFEIEGSLFLRSSVFDALVNKQKLIHELRAELERARGGETAISR